MQGWRIPLLAEGLHGERRWFRRSAKSYRPAIPYGRHRAFGGDETRAGKAEWRAQGEPAKNDPGILEGFGIQGPERNAECTFVDCGFDAVATAVGGLSMEGSVFQMPIKLRIVVQVQIKAILAGAVKIARQGRKSALQVRGGSTWCRTRDCGCGRRPTGRTPTCTFAQPGQRPVNVYHATPQIARTCQPVGARHRNGVRLRSAVFLSVPTAYIAVG